MLMLPDTDAARYAISCRHADACIAASCCRPAAYATPRFRAMLMPRQPADIAMLPSDAMMPCLRC